MKYSYQMEKLIKPGRLIFSSGFIALGIVCFISKDFIIGRPPAWPESIAINPALAYITGTLVMISGLAIIVDKNTTGAALLIALLILLFSISRHIPQFMNDWANAYKSMALFGGCLIVASSGFGNKDGFRNSEKIKKYFLFTGTVLLAAFFIVCAYAHFKFAEFVKNLIPDYIPFHSFWTYFAGICLFAGGIGLLIPRTRKWAALLSGIMVLGWFLLLHIPRFIANTNDVSDRMGVCESFIFVGIFFVLAGIQSRKK
jgi:uncharacterized membrane protein